jgi:hypothetical protein
MFSQEFFRIAQAKHLYQFNNTMTPYTTDAATGQEYMNVAPTRIEAHVVPSKYVFGTPDKTKLTKAEIHSRGVPDVHILGALYYKDGKPLDYQYGISETGKPGENHFDCANRGLIEELGLEFTGTPAHFTKFTKDTRSGKQDCQVFVVHASEVHPVGASVPQKIVTRMNQADSHGGVQVKSQVIIYGTERDLIKLGAEIEHKPVQPGTHEFYDASIKGFAILSA